MGDIVGKVTAFKYGGAIYETLEELVKTELEIDFDKFEALVEVYLKDKGSKSTPEASEEGVDTWHPWNPGETLMLRPDVEVEVKLRNGEIIQGKVGHYNWNRIKWERDREIISYRLLD